MAFDQRRPFIYCNWRKPSSTAGHNNSPGKKSPGKKKTVIAAGFTSDRKFVGKFYEMVSWAGPFVEHMCLHPIYDWIPISEASSTLSTWIRYSEYFNELFTWLLALILTSASCARLKKCGLSKNRYPMVFQNLMNHQVSLLHGHNWGYGNKKKG